ncbi:FUSC family protein [Bacillus fonticola]|uniref:FUSC family protein n=1 Tax=Bacillus fonticola TaxID=2728853 RepID=UPI00147607A3|nr:aromatic acid exporter family protein [Bacillus fonticola]
MKLGARVLKTGVAIMLSLWLSQLFGLPSPLFAGIAAIFAIQPTIYRSYLSILDQIQSNLVGAVVAFLFVYFLGNDILVIGLAAVLVIAMNLKMKTEQTIGLSLVTVIAIMESPGTDLFQFSLIRFSTVMTGVVSAFLVNLLFLPPKYETKLYRKISHTTEEIIKWIRVSTRHASEYHLLKADIEKQKEQLIKLDQLYLMFNEERSYLKRTTRTKARKLVVYRHMISTTRRAWDLLKKINRFENDLHHMPDDFQSVIQEQLDTLTVQHEQLYLQFLGKIRLQDHDFETNYCEKRKELLNLFLRFERLDVNKDDNDMYHMMHLISAIVQYGEHLDHLETLIHSFQSFHEKENTIEIKDEEE